MPPDRLFAALVVAAVTLGPVCANLAEPVGKIVTGGAIAPDGKTQVDCDLPANLLRRNVGGRDGAGLCVFTSIEYAAIWQNESRLDHFQDPMRREPGGGYPSKVDAMIAKYGKGTPYLQYEGKDPGTVIEAALKSGRIPCITYNGRDGVHYHGSIAHMVCCVAFDRAANLAAIRDNNFIGENDLVWMSCDELLDRCKGGGGWVVVLLAPPPPPPPRN